MLRKNCLDVVLLPKQYDFVADTRREVLYSGAYGSGKSYALCVKLIMRGVRSGARELLVRKTNVSLKKTTLVMLLEMLDKYRIPYELHKSEQRIDFRSGGVIFYSGLDDFKKLGSMNLSGVACDEAAELTENDWDQLRGRIREPHPNGNCIYGATNPDSPLHFLAQRFGLSPYKEIPEQDCFAYRTRTPDNKHLPPDYVENLSRLKGTALARYYEGLWVQAEGAIYPDALEYFIDPETPPTGKTLLGLDFGFKDPTACVFGTVYPSTTGEIIYIYDEFYQSGCLLKDIASVIKTKLPIEYFGFYDPSAAQQALELASYDISLYKAENDINYGIKIVNQLFYENRLYISDSCTNLKKELAAYCWKDNVIKEAPIDINNHLCDALRYLCASAVKHKIITIS